MSQKPVHRYVSLEQIEQMRDAAHNRELRYDSLGRRLRDELVIVLGIDLGLRASELVNLTSSMVNLDNDEVMLPSHIQKDYPTDDSPSAATLRLDPYSLFTTRRLLRSYFNSDWYVNQDTDYLLPSRQSDQMSRESIRNIVRDLAIHAGVEPRRTDGEPGEPEEAHPHMLRHSLANYMLRDEETRLIDVRNRLRHRSISTTERIYEHFQRR